MATRRRMSLTSLFSSMRSSVHSVSKESCDDPFFFGLAMGTKYELVRRPSTISLVIPSSEKRKWRVGSSNGELMMGFSMTTPGIRSSVCSSSPASAAQCSNRTSVRQRWLGRGVPYRAATAVCGQATGATAVACAVMLDATRDRSRPGNLAGGALWARSRGPVLRGTAMLACYILLSTPLTVGYSALEFAAPYRGTHSK